MTTTQLVLSIIAAVLLFALLYVIIKELIKVVAVFAVLAIIYTGYLSLSGQKIPSSREELIQQGVHVVQSIKENGSKMLESTVNERALMENKKE